MKNLLFRILSMFAAPFVYGMMCVTEGGAGTTDEDKEKEEALLKKINAIIERKQAGVITEEKMLEKLEEVGITAKVFKDLSDAVEKQGLVIQGLSAAKERSMSLEEVLKAEDSGIKDAKNKKIHEFEFKVTKANVTTASVADNTESFRIQEIGQVGTRRTILRDILPVIPVGANSNGTITYADWNEDTLVRAAAMRAEGIAFPESTAEWREKSITLKKLSDSIPVTEEALVDTARFAAELRLFLQTNIQLLEDTQLATGNGVGDNLTGLFTSATAYTAAASGITDASHYDLIVKMAEAIVEEYGSKYQPNFVAMKTSEINKMKLKKDQNNNYVMPPFVAGNGAVVDGMTVIPVDAMAVNTIVVGDSRFARIYEVEGFSISVGFINDQFVKDLFTLKAKKREALLIRDVDKTGFLKSENLSGDLVTLAT